VAPQRRTPAKEFNPADPNGPVLRQARFGAANEESSMKTPLVSGLALVLLTGGGFAQAPPSPSLRPPQARLRHRPHRRLRAWQPRGPPPRLHRP
jgi:hypothetical protein